MILVGYNKMDNREFFCWISSIIQLQWVENFAYQADKFKLDFLKKNLKFVL